MKKILPKLSSSEESKVELFYPHTALIVCDIDPRGERLVMLAHAFSDPHYFAYTDER
jgi:hypothetical protein